MTFRPSAYLLAALLALASASAFGQEPTPTPTPEPTPSTQAPPATSPREEAPPAPPPVPPGAPPPAPTPGPEAAQPPPPVAPVVVPTPTPLPPARITDSAVLAVLQAPSENPFGHLAEAPAALPPKLTFADAVVSGSRFVSARVDATGKPMGSRADRDPIPSLSADAQKSLARWVFDPARRGSQAVETWAALRLELEVEVDAPRGVQAALVPVTPTTPLPRPFPWPSDDAWLESRTGPSPADGTVAIDAVDTPPMPRKTPWDADSHRGPFSAKFWVKVNSNGTVEKAIPLEVSEPILLGYLRRSMSSWAFRPARVAGTLADSWNEITLSGQVSYKVEIKQITSLRRPLTGS